MSVLGRTPMQTLTLKSGLWFVLGLSIFTLVTYNMRDRIWGTPISVKTVQNGSSLTSPFLSISGSAAHARELRINGRTVAVDRHGTFTDEVVLSPGYNIVEVQMTNQFGIQKSRVYQVVFTAPQAVATLDHTPYQ